MKIRDVFLAASLRLERGESHYCCTAVAAAVGWDWSNPRVGVYSCPETRRFLEVAVENVKPDLLDEASWTLRDRIRAHVNETVGPNASEAQRQAAAIRHRVEILRKAADAVGDEEMS